MRIKKVEIKNYRSCNHTVFEPNESLSALIGPNGSGKTNILSAIKLISSLTSIRRRRHIQDHGIQSPCEIKTWYDLDGNNVIHTAKIHLVTNERNQDEILSSDETWYMHSITGSKKRIKIPFEIFADIIHEREYFYHADSHFRSRFFGNIFGKKNISEKAISSMAKIMEYVKGITYYSASQFTNPSNCPISFEVEGDEKARRGISITGHKRFLYEMYQEYINKSDSYKEFIEIIGPNGIGLVEDIEFKEIQTSSSNYSVMAGGRVTKREKVNLLVIPGFHVSGSNLSPSQLSEGTFKTLALTFYLITDKSTLLMIEEPEVCVHHGLLHSIVELIKLYAQEKQIFISTHSDSVLDSLDMPSIFRVMRGIDNGTTISSVAKSIRGKELEALKYYLENEGSLGEFWKHGDLESV